MGYTSEYAQRMMKTGDKPKSSAGGGSKTANKNAPVQNKSEKDALKRKVQSQKSTSGSSTPSGGVNKGAYIKDDSARLKSNVNTNSGVNIDKLRNDGVKTRS